MSRPKVEFELREPVRVAESRQVYIYLEHSETGVPATIWGPTRGERRQKLTPECVDAQWHRNNGGDWVLRHLLIHGSNRYHTYQTTALVDGKLRAQIDPWVITQLMPHAPEGWSLD